MTASACKGPVTRTVYNVGMAPRRPNPYMTDELTGIKPVHILTKIERMSWKADPTFRRGHWVTPPRLWMVSRSGSVIGPMDSNSKTWGACKNVRPCGFVHSTARGINCKRCEEVKATAAKRRQQYNGMYRRLLPKVLSRDNCLCVRCGTDDDLTIDHIFPLALGGTNDLENLQTLCMSCNCRKGARLEAVPD